MADIGKINRLKVLRRAEQGFYLEGEGNNDILLPNAYIPENCEIDDEIDVFIYRDSEDRIIATTQTPFAKVGEFACLKVVAVTRIGAFMDWGLMKDLMVPHREQKYKMTNGQSYVVYVYLDEDSDRIAASSKIEKYLDKQPIQYAEGQEVEVLIYEQTDLGFKAIINDNHSGIIYENEVFQALDIGDTCKAYIKKIRSDGKLDLSLQKPGVNQSDEVSEIILQRLKEYDGFLEVNDKSQAELIYAQFGISKKVFKKAIGHLYKRRLITFVNDGIKMVNEH